MEGELDYLIWFFYFRPDYPDLIEYHLDHRGGQACKVANLFKLMSRCTYGTLMNCDLYESVHLVVTSPPYWNLKRYNENVNQLGHVQDYESFLGELKKVWRQIIRVLVPGGRLVCVVGDVCVARRNYGRHLVFPLHADICVTCRRNGFDNLSPIVWHKIANASYEVTNGSKFLGKSYEPNAIIKNDMEFILMDQYAELNKGGNR